MSTKNSRDNMRFEESCDSFRSQCLLRSVRRQQDSVKLIRFVARRTCGEVSERFKEHAWKACVGEILPWVRIPPSPPFLYNQWVRSFLHSNLKKSPALRF